MTPPLRLGFLLLFGAVSAVAADNTTDVGPLSPPRDNGQPTVPHERFWDYYTPRPSNYIGSQEWWRGDSLLGDFWGLRNGLDADGVHISATYANNIAGNPVGGTGKGFTYADNTSFGVDLDLQKLIGWHGATLTVSGLNRDGTSLSQTSLGNNQFTVQQIYGGSAVMFYGLFLDQKFWNDKASLKIGRFATGDDFASSPLYWLYMNNGIDGNPQALPVNSQFSAYPWSVWAARLKVQVTPTWTNMLGIYQISNRIFDRSYHGLDWSIRPNDSFMLIDQLGWAPEFFKRPVYASDTHDGKNIIDGKSVADDKSGKSIYAPVMKGYPGHYWFGAYWSPWEYSQFGTSQKTTDAYGFYLHADQMVYQEAPGSDQGLTVWSAFVLSPQQYISKVPFQVNGGLAYKGLIPTRDDDWTTLGVIYGEFSNDYAQATQTAGNGFPTYELVFEGGYKIQINKFAFFQPDIQYIINPGGTGDVPNALVLGAQMGVTF